MSVSEDLEDIVVDVAVEDLWPYSCVVNRIWVEREDPVIKHQIRACIAAGEFEPVSYQAVDKVEDTDWHVRRIAWLVENGWDDPIQLEIANSEHQGHIITDGHHRVAAAIYRGDETIRAVIYGFYEDAPHHLPSLRKMAVRCACASCSEPRWILGIETPFRDAILFMTCYACGGEIVQASLI